MKRCFLPRSGRDAAVAVDSHPLRHAARRGHSKSRARARRSRPSGWESARPKTPCEISHRGETTPAARRGAARRLRRLRHVVASRSPEDVLRLIRPPGSRRTGARRFRFYAVDANRAARVLARSAPTAVRVELDTDRKIRTRNKLYYRFNHWPIWIFVFFIAPGPLTFDLFERGFDQRMLTWLGDRAARDGHRRAVRQAARVRAGAVHHSLHRGSAESAVSPHLLHDRVGRSDRVCGPQCRRPGLRDRDRRMAAEADV